jgi:hypothetical protein
MPYKTTWRRKDPSLKVPTLTPASKYLCNIDMMSLQRGTSSTKDVLATYIGEDPM